MLIINSIRTMLFSFCVDISCGKCLIDGVDLMQLFAKAHDKIFRFDISMHIIFIMDKLNTAKYLLGDHQSGSQCKLSSAYIKIFLQRVAKQLSDQESKIPVLAKPN